MEIVVTEPRLLFVWSRRKICCNLYVEDVTFVTTINPAASPETFIKMGKDKFRVLQNIPNGLTVDPNLENHRKGATQLNNYPSI